MGRDSRTCTGGPVCLNVRWSVADPPRSGEGDEVELKARRTARVMVFDPEGRVLLIRCEVRRLDGDEFVFWLTPGGEIEPGEEPADAAVRELREELGLKSEVKAAYTETNQFEHQGEMRVDSREGEYTEVLILIPREAVPA